MHVHTYVSIQVLLASIIKKQSTDTHSNLVSIEIIIPYKRHQTPKAAKRTLQFRCAFNGGKCRDAG